MVANMIFKQDVQNNIVMTKMAAICDWWVGEKLPFLYHTQRYKKYGTMIPGIDG